VWVLTSLFFVPPDRRAYDDDNLEARFKAGRDGLADAAGTSDRDWRPTRRVGAGQPPGCVVATMRNLDIPG
jgi:crossover junction endodeoxyribonuclease RusA